MNTLVKQKTLIQKKKKKAPAEQNLMLGQKPLD